MRRELGLDHDWPVVIVGAGNLGQALAGYGGFRASGASRSPASSTSIARRSARTIGGIEVRRLADLPAIVAGCSGSPVSIGVVATPAAAAQDAADRLVAAGVTSIPTSPRCCSPCPPWSVRKVDLAIELQILSYYEQRRAAPDRGRPTTSAHRTAS